MNRKIGYLANELATQSNILWTMFTIILGLTITLALGELVNVLKITASSTGDAIGFVGLMLVAVVAIVTVIWTRPK